jgi:hypothetical protein
MKRGGQAFRLGLLSSCLLCAFSAHAQVSAADKASAEALFNDGIALVRAGRFAEGCAKFEGSQALEPTLGTELRLADCYDRVGKTASAWALFKESQGLAHRQGEEDREDVARQRADDLAQRLSYLVLEVDEPLPPGLAIERNGQAVLPALLGSRIPVDPGPQTITARAPGRRTRADTVLVPPQPGEVRWHISPLESLPPPRVISVTLHPEAPRSDPKRSVGIVTGVVGLVAVGAGAGFGWYAMHLNDRSRSNAYCPTAGHNGCTHEGVALRERAQAFARASTITLAAGGALLATGIVLWSTSNSPRRPRTELSLAAFPGVARAELGASW